MECDGMRWNAMDGMECDGGIECDGMECDEWNAMEWDGMKWME